MTRSKVLTAVALGTLAGALLAVSATVALAGRLPTTIPHAQHITLVIVGSGTSQWVSPSHGSVAVAAGVPVRVTVINLSPEYHTFTVPGLGVSALIRPAHGKTPTKTTFTFTAWKTGTFAWHCAYCAKGAHGHPHEMGGRVYAIVDPSMLP